MIVVAGLLLVGGLAAVVRAGAGADPLDRARALVADEGGFTTATDAGVTFTKVSALLAEAAESCADGEGADGSRCQALFAGAGYARVSAAGVLRCTRPGVFDARTALGRYLDAVDADGGASPPEPPPVVNCA